MRALASLCSVLVVAACGGGSEEASPDAMPPVVVPDAMPPVVVPDAAVPDAMPPANIRFVDLAEDAIVAREQRTAIESFDARGVVRMELFIDTGRLGEDTVVPFAIDWTTRDFADGPHELRARAHFGDGTSADLAITVRIDNTPPVVTVPESIVSNPEDPSDLEVTVTDYTGIERVTIDTEQLTTAPYRIRWWRRCGSYGFGVSATDLAGNYTQNYYTVQTIDPRDRDCDGVLSPAAGGDDCNDDDATTHPRATDSGSDPIDHNCDGMPGVDADGDHVATRESGGEDCDDTRADVHGVQLRWQEVRPRRGDGEELDLIHHDFARAAIGGAAIHVLDAGGQALVHRGFDLAGVERVVHALPEIPTDWSRRSFLAHAGQLLIAHVDGDNQVRLARWSGGSWSQESVAAVPGGVSHLELAAHGARLHIALVDYNGAVHLAERGAGGWTSRVLATDHRLKSVGRIDVERSVVVAFGPELVARARHGVAPVEVRLVPIRDADVTGATTFGDVLLYARTWSGTYDADGRRVTLDGWWMRTMRMPFFGEVLVAGNGGHFALLDTSSDWPQLIVHRPNGRALRWPGRSEGDDIIFYGDGPLVVLDDPLLPAADAAGDGVDSDCDGTDG